MGSSSTEVAVLKLHDVNDFKKAIFFCERSKINAFEIKAKIREIANAVATAAVYWTYMNNLFVVKDARGCA